MLNTVGHLSSYGLSVRFKPGRGIQCDPTHEGSSFLYKFAVLCGRTTVLDLNGKPLDDCTLKDGKVERPDVAVVLAREIVVERLLKNTSIRPAAVR